MEGWHVRPYRPGDEPGIVALYEQVFGYTRTPEWWLWKAKTFSAPDETTWVAVSDEDGRIVGHTAGIPTTMKLNGEVRPVIVNVDAMTAPEFRRRGILLRLGEAGNKHWREMGYAAVVGLPNEQWGSRIAALGWETMFPLAWLRFPLHIGRTLSRPGRLPHALSRPARTLGEIAARAWARPRISRLARRARAEGINVKGGVSAEDSFDQLWSSLEGHYRNAIVRDARYVRWRFQTALPEPYKVLTSWREGLPTGYVAYRTSGLRDTANGYIADLLTAPADRASAYALLSAALEDIWRAGAGMAMVTAAPGSPLYRLLKSAGALPSSARTAFKYNLILLDPALSRQELAHAEHWLASGSDSDVV